MRNFLLIFLMLFCAHPSFSESTFVTYSPYSTNFRYTKPQNYTNNMFYYPNRRYYQNYADMNSLERYTFNRSYPYENPASRLQRLERQAYGAERTGNFLRRYENVKSAILSRPKNNYYTKKRLEDYYEGQMTGFTPQISPSVMLLD